ncbi:hypothetical protein K458DRAFT_89697 [Lentithecium fluviatile CBS 122367]|uniref:Uncharacterized protein n=1 Tax=Lentithecium fluviatile CBS 122367 TaxID=1168545 RepID=A0A6G1IRQ9_9PLEO|nr:hypothetical protein K458DRAFT_89697 [Lentithecium fluviatile CBS 122367]
MGRQLERVCTRGYSCASLQLFGRTAGPCATSHASSASDSHQRRRSLLTARPYRGITMYSTSSVMSSLRTRTLLMPWFSIAVVHESKCGPHRRAVSSRSNTRAHLTLHIHAENNAFLNLSIIPYRRGR